MTCVWPQVRLGEVLAQDRHYISVPEAKVYPKLSVKLYGKGVVLDAPVDGTQLRMQRHQLAKAGQVILSEIWGKKGAIGFVPPEGEGALCTSHFFLFDVDRGRLDPRWLQALFTANYLEAQLGAEAKGTTGYASVRPATLLACEIPCPPLLDQQRLVGQISSVVAELEVRATGVKKGEAELSSLLRSVFTQLTTGARRRRMGDVAPLVRRPVTVEPDGSYPELGVRSFGRGLFDKPVLRGADLTWQNLFRVEEGDLVFSNIKAWEGAFAVAETRHHGMVGSHRYLTCVADPSCAIPNFVWFALQSPDGLEQMCNASPGSADRNRTLSQSALNAIEIPLPSLDAQGWFDALQIEVAKARAARVKADAEAAQLLPALLAETF